MRRRNSQGNHNHRPKNRRLIIMVRAKGRKRDGVNTILESRPWAGHGKGKKRGSLLKTPRQAALGYPRARAELLRTILTGGTGETKNNENMGEIKNPCWGGKLNQWESLPDVLEYSTNTTP